MQTIIIVIHLLVVLALVAVVLLQRSEGGGLGIGGGSGLMTARGASNALTRATAILATAFFITSLGLSILARYGESPLDILDRVPVNAPTSTDAPSGGGNGVLDQLGGAPTPAAPAAPTAPSGDGAANPLGEPAAVPPATQPAGATEEPEAAPTQTESDSGSAPAPASNAPAPAGVPSGQ